jgi:hypothetical protein
MNPDDQAREWEQVPITDPPPEPGNPRRSGSHRQQRPPTPNWLKAWYAFLVLVAFLVIVSGVLPPR